MRLSKQDNGIVYRCVLRNGRNEQVRLKDGTLANVTIRKKGCVTMVHVEPAFTLDDVG